MRQFDARRFGAWPQRGQPHQLTGGTLSAVLTIMARSRTARPRASGFRIQRSALGLALATLLCTGTGPIVAAPAPRIAYLSIPESPVVTWRGHHIGPRIA